MLDAFARQAYRAHLTRADSLVDAFSTLPNDTLRKLASGHLSCGGDSKEWLERFQGTPLYDQAMELLQEELQQEAEELQTREQQHAFYSAGDQLRLKKKLLELELARSQMAPTPNPSLPPTEEAPTATAPGPQGAATQSSVQPPEGAPPKTAEALWAAALLPQDEKRSSANFAAALEKMGGIGSAVLNIAKNNPGLAAGTAIGAIGGGVRGAQQKIDPTTGQPVGGGITGALTGAVGGGVLGGAVGLGAQGLGRSALRAHGNVSALKEMNPAANPSYWSALKQQMAKGGKHFMGDVSQVGGGLQESAGAAAKRVGLWGRPAVVPPTA